jgi:hypothetical protein
MARYDVISICMTCGAVYGYTSVADADEPPKYSHGYCMDCAVKALEMARQIGRAA